MNYFKLMLFSACVSMMGCSNNYKMVQHQRDEAFFKAYQNPAEELGQAAARIESVKLLHTNDDYPIRISLYNNGKFYYQVDELGAGIGDWKYENGGLHLTSRRKIFDLNFYVTAAGETGDQVEVKFFDRHGFNRFPLDFRNPSESNASGKPVEKLREFKSSIKDI